MEPVAIGARNPRLRRLRRLASRRKARSEERAFVVDGPTLVGDVLRSDLEVREIYAGPGSLDEAGLTGLVGPEVEVYEVEATVLEAVLDPINPRPLAAVVAMPEEVPPTELARFLPASAGPVLVAVELRDPGNLGTILRTAEAAGLAGVVVAGASVDRFSPKVVRASAGSVFRVPVVDVRDPVEAIDHLAAAGRPVLAAVVGPGAGPYDGADLTEAAILVGNEPNGLPPEVVERATGRITIPMAAGVESLNVAAAASVLSFEAARQRRAAAVARERSRGEIRWTGTDRRPNVATMNDHP